MLTQKTSGPSVLQTGRVLFLPLGAIRPNPAQPRSVFDAAGLQELAASIRQYGVLQPLSVRKKGSGFELVAGERRLRAAGLAGLREVPCLLVTADDQDAGLLALVENLDEVAWQAPDQSTRVWTVDKADAYLQKLTGEYNQVFNDTMELPSVKDCGTPANLARLRRVTDYVEQYRR